jgi:hypothetical protein
MEAGMRLLVRFVKILISVIVVGLIGLGTWLYVSPPELLRVGSGYSAKMVCSNVFLAGRDSGEVLAVDVQAPGNPLLRLMQVSVDRTEKRVHAALLGIFAGNDAVYREGLGCAVTPDAAPVAAVSVPAPAVTSVDPSLLWPEGGKIEADPSVAQVLSDADLAGPGMRAVVVVKWGHIVGETYSAGFSKDTPLIGWSMTKTVNAAILGTLIRDGKLSLEDKGLFPQWQGNQRGDIRIADLAAMESGLAFNENYGAVADVTRMLYLEPDMANFAADQPLDADPGSRFGYSSGTAVMLSKIWMDRIGGGTGALIPPCRPVRSARHDNRRHGSRCGRHICRQFLYVCDGPRLGPDGAAACPRRYLERQPDFTGRFCRPDAPAERQVERPVFENADLAAWQGRSGHPGGCVFPAGA